MAKHAQGFAITRDGGQSNVQVILAVLKDGDPGRVFTHEELVDALNVGASQAFTVQRMQAVVRHALKPLATLHQRTIHAVPGIGYRVALANEHMGLAVHRQGRAERQYRMGLLVLEQVKWEEMGDNDRNAHQGHLMISRAIYENQIALHSRMNKIEKAIHDLKGNTSNTSEAAIAA